MPEGLKVRLSSTDGHNLCLLCLGEARYLSPLCQIYQTGPKKSLCTSHDLAIGVFSMNSYGTDSAGYFGAASPTGTIWLNLSLRSVPHPVARNANSQTGTWGLSPWHHLWRFWTHYFGSHNLGTHCDYGARLFLLTWPTTLMPSVLL